MHVRHRERRKLKGATMCTVHMASQLTDAYHYTLCGLERRDEGEDSYERSGVIALRYTSDFFRFKENRTYTKCSRCPEVLDLYGRRVVDSPDN